MSIFRRRKSKKKVIVIGLDCLTPQLAFEQYAEVMPTFRQLREQGAFGLLESVIPPITVPAWACMTTGKRPGTLGIYGFRNRIDNSYDQLSIVNSQHIREKAVWDYLTDAGKSSILMGIPPGYPPKPLKGHAISCFLTPSTDGKYTYPPELQGEIQNLVGEFMFDVKGFRTDDKDWLLEQIYRLTEQRFAVATYLMDNKEWDFLMFVDMGPDRLHHGFWRYGDPDHIFHEPGNRFKHVMKDYYRFLDEQIGRFLEHMPSEAQLIVVSDHGAKRMDGGICINEWLRKEGYLTLKSSPTGVGPLESSEVDWARTMAWGEGGYYSRIFINLKGRETQGAVAPGEYESLRDELTAKLEALGDEHGNSIGTEVHKPEEIYRQCKGIPPDLIAIFGDLHWRSVGSVGGDSIWVHENDTGPDDANHAQHGIFVAHNVAGLSGEMKDLHLTQMAATFLELLEVSLPWDLEAQSIL